MKRKLGYIVAIVAALVICGAGVSVLVGECFKFIRGPGYWQARYSGLGLASYDGGRTFSKLAANRLSADDPREFPELYLDIPGVGRRLLSELREETFENVESFRVEHGRDAGGNEYTMYCYGTSNGPFFMFQSGVLVTVRIEAPTRIRLAIGEKGENMSLPITKKNMIRILGKPEKIEFVPVPWGA